MCLFLQIFTGVFFSFSHTALIPFKAVPLQSSLSTQPEATAQKPHIQTTNTNGQRNMFFFFIDTDHNRLNPRFLHNS